jgi:hypothetical protein
VALGSGGELWLAGEGDAPPELVARAHDADAAGPLTVHSGEATAREAVDWITGGGQALAEEAPVPK